MAKLHHVKKARKAIPEAGIEKGESYWFYKRMVNGKGAPRVCSKTKPRRSAYATSSPFLGGLMDLEDDLNNLLAVRASVDEVSTWLGAAADAVGGMGEECLAKSSNVQDGMKNGAGQVSSEMLRSRADHCSVLAVAMREAANEVVLAINEVPSEDEEGEGECEPSTTSMADVLSVLVWLP